MPTGYAHPGYVESLAEFGTPLELPGCGGWLLAREIPGSRWRDAIGGYPIFACRDWSKLADDLVALGRDLVSVSLVADPFGTYEIETLRACFRDACRPLDDHFVADLQRPFEEIVSRHHRKIARKARVDVETEALSEPAAFLEEWLELHGHLVSRHGIEGIRAFSRTAFEKQLSLPGMVVLTARCDGELLGAQLWITGNDVAYGHVLGFTERGYAINATYALYAFALEYFSGRVRWCDFGGVPASSGGDSGLARFKRGWSTDTRSAWFCGRILDADRYDHLVAGSRRAPGGFFPAYRSRF